MTYTRHGHHIPGTPLDDEPDVRMRCGGIGVCKDCSAEALRNEFIAVPFKEGSIPMSTGAKVTKIPPADLSNEALRLECIKAAARCYENRINWAHEDPVALAETFYSYVRP